MGLTGYYLGNCFTSTESGRFKPCVPSVTWHRCREHPTLPTRVCRSDAQGGHGPCSMPGLRHPLPCQDGGWHRGRRESRRKTRMLCHLQTLLTCWHSSSPQGRENLFIQRPQPHSVCTKRMRPRAEEQDLLPRDQRTQLSPKAGSGCASSSPPRHP